jgi:hypothetical protein
MCSLSSGGTGSTTGGQVGAEAAGAGVDTEGAQLLREGTGEERAGSIQLLDLEGLDSVARIEEVSQGISDTFSLAWCKCGKEVTITSCSKPWWNQECADAICQYREDRSPRKWKSFCRATCKAKRVFFNARIEEISDTNIHPWDLMEWVKQRKLPVCEAIQFQGQPCHTLESLWDALHGTYNAASGRQVDLTALEDLDPLPERDWVRFSSREMFDALSVCSSCSAPGPDHVMWTHLKRILPDSIVSGKILSLADACLWVGYWPTHFKESVSVIIPKLGKPSYSTPKSFWPIVLLNTLGKLIEKMISTWL